MWRTLSTALIILACVCCISTVDFKPMMFADHTSRNEMTLNMNHFIATCPQKFEVGSTTNMTVIIEKNIGETEVYVSLKEEGTNDIIAVTSTLIRWYQKGKPQNLEITIPPNVNYGFGLLTLEIKGGLSVKKLIRVRLTKSFPKLFLKSDKFIYTRGDNVRVWTFAVADKLLPYDGNINDVSIEDNDGAILVSKKNIPLQSGSCSLLFKLPKSAKAGKYKIKAKVEGHIGSISFLLKDTVQEHNRATNFVMDFPIIGSSAQQRVKKQLNQRYTSTSDMDASSLFDIYSISKSFVSVQKPIRPLQVNKRAKIVIIYNNPKEGMNKFYFQVQCKGNVAYSGSTIDLYSSYLCLRGLSIFDRLDIMRGPSRRALCKRNATKFLLKFKVTRDMTPSCSLLVYRIFENSEIVADKIRFQVEKEFANEVSLEVDKFDVVQEQEIMLTISGQRNSKIHVLGQKWIPEPFHQQQDAIGKMEVFSFLRDLERDKHIATLIHKCATSDIITTKQVFQDVGLVVMSNLETDPAVFCQDINRLHGRSNNVVKGRAAKGSRPIQLVKSNTWIWEEQFLWTTQINKKVKVPKETGIWFLQAISFSKETGLGLSDIVLVQVKPQLTTPSPKATKHPAPLRMPTTQIQNFTAEVVPTYSFEQQKSGMCRALSLKLCFKGNKQDFPQPKERFFVFEVTNVAGFSLVEKDIEKALTTFKAKTFGLQASGQSIKIFCQKCILQNCVTIRMNQHQKLKNNFGEGNVKVSTMTAKGNFLHQNTSFAIKC